MDSVWITITIPKMNILGIVMAAEKHSPISFHIHALPLLTFPVYLN